MTKEKICLECGNKYKNRDKRSKFCGKSCSSRYNNLKRTLPSMEQRLSVSKSLKIYWNRTEKRMERAVKLREERANRHLKRKVCRKPNNIFEISSRTMQKILIRLDMSCVRCQWNESTCDIHHIVPGNNAHKHLIYLCPNCHRLAHRGKINERDYPNLLEQVGELWRKYYYG